VKFGASSRRS